VTPGSDRGHEQVPGVTEGWPRSGVHRFPEPFARVARVLAERGWDVAVVPPSRTDPQLWDGLAAALHLPAWFGRNLDALDEVLADRRRPTALVLASWWAYATARPDRWAALLQLLQERAAGQPPLVVVLAD
jgi:RNAse (barnase) inhibitor barstar